jgi:hypothetical protein
MLMFEVMNLQRKVRWLMATLLVASTALSRADCFDRYQRLPRVLTIPMEPVAFAGGNSIPVWYLGYEMARSRSLWTTERAATHQALGCFEFFWESEAGEAEFSFGSVVSGRVVFTTDLQQTFPFLPRDSLYQVVDFESPDSDPFWPGAWSPIDSEEIGAVWTRGLGGYAVRLRFNAGNAVGVAHWFTDSGEGSSKGLRIVAQRLDCGTW